MFQHGGIFFHFLLRSLYISLFLSFSPSLPRSCSVVLSISFFLLSAVCLYLFFCFLLFCLSFICLFFVRSSLLFCLPIVLLCSPFLVFLSFICLLSIYRYLSKLMFFSLPHSLSYVVYSLFTHILSSQLFLRLHIFSLYIAHYFCSISLSFPVCF
jgi:hypothetical protein